MRSDESLNKDSRGKRREHKSNVVKNVHDMESMIN